MQLSFVVIANSLHLLTIDRFPLHLRNALRLRLLIAIHSMYILIRSLTLTLFTHVKNFENILLYSLGQSSYNCAIRIRIITAKYFSKNGLPFRPF